VCLGPGPYTAGAGPGPAAMRVHVDDPESAEALVEFLRRRACTAAREADDVVDVELPDQLDPEREVSELDLYLAVFRSIHPDARVRILR